jgi:hypothetical protein
VCVGARIASFFEIHLHSQSGKFLLSSGASESHLRKYYGTLFQAWGAQHWWPAESQFEVVVGSYLTQNAAWTNVERALHNLRSATC